jgi:hypothetical protein
LRKRRVLCGEAGCEDAGALSGWLSCAGEEMETAIAKVAARELIDLKIGIIVPH